MTSGSGLADACRSQANSTLDLLTALIAEPSVEGNDMAIARCLDLVHDALAPLARETLRPIHDSLPALVMRFGSPGAARHLSFVGHVDVVPAEGAWSSPPFALSVADDRAVGRGVVDMKGGVAAAVGAIQSLAATGLLDTIAVELVLSGDEEVGSARGVRALLAAGEITGDAAICPEPTNLAVYLGNRGVLGCEITVTGRGGHAGLLESLSSPVPTALALATALGELPLSARDQRFDPPTPSLAVTRFVADGGAPNVVPDTVTIGLDRRLLPGEDIDEAIRTIEGLAAELVRSPLSAAVRVLKRWPPCETPADAAITRAAVAGVQAAGRHGALGMDRPANDSSWLVEAGIPALLLGPGAPEAAHVTDEWLQLSELRDAVRAYAELAIAYAAE